MPFKDLRTHLLGSKPFIIGLYGVPGCGKSYLLDNLRSTLDPKDCKLFEGSAVLDSLVPGGLSAFKKLDKGEMTIWRGKAIDAIVEECRREAVVGVVAGHLTFWDEGEEKGAEVWTVKDQEAYDFIIYLEQPPRLVVERRGQDKERSRPPVTASHIRNWQTAEKDRLMEIHREHRIGFAAANCPWDAIEKIKSIVGVTSLNADKNIVAARRALDQAIIPIEKEVDVVLVFDADRTLAPQDSGSLVDDECSKGDVGLIRLIFSTLDYTYRALEQATALCERYHTDEEFEGLCGSVSQFVEIYADIKELLASAQENPRIKVFVVTCGWRRIWQRVLQREGLADKITIVGGGRFSDGFVVTPEVKEDLVARLRDEYKKVTYSFGDSPVDLGMLQQAHRAIVIVGGEKTRSKTMDQQLGASIEKGLVARQIIFDNATPRLDTTTLPVTTVQQVLSEIREIVKDGELLTGVTSKVSENPRFQHLTDSAASKILATPTRDASFSGPILRDAHRRIGYYLAINLISEIVGVETYSIPHVQGRPTEGHRLRDEAETAIVAIMRGGEPMASGVNDAFPLASFVHAGEADELTPRRINDRKTIILVDSVINSGKTIVEFVEKVRLVSEAVRIVVVAGVVQADVMDSGTGTMARMLTGDGNAWLVALRMSKNKFTGKGGTDTGNRLFNTTQMD
ncbi:hypothetical protein MD484_g2220, partial [Candolleomyces efflorescens]